MLGKTNSGFSARRSVVPDGKDSLAVYTSIDTALSAYISRLMRRYHPLYGALAALDPVSGRIFTLVTYTGDSMPDLGGNLCLRSLFPAASVFKTVTAAAAIEHGGYTAWSQVKHRGRMSTLYRSQLVPEIDDGNELTFAQAYARSINGVFGRIGMYTVGKERLLEMSGSLGFNRTIPGELICDSSKVYPSESDYNLAETASGFNQKTTLSPLLGALVASAVAVNGCMPVPTLIDSVVRVKDGSLRYSAQPAMWRRAISESTARELRDMMSAVVKYGTASKHFHDFKNSRRFAEFACGGKTGSVDKDGIGRVDWFIGFAAHPRHPDERIAVAAVTAHGAYWTVHSSYLASEAMRVYLRTLQERKKQYVADAATSGSPAPPPDVSSSSTETGP
jgi:cell division protein FtsI/penicillin-binding protein 2